jgi:plasmid stabilization system protein ParE
MKYTVSITPRAELDREVAYDWYAENYSPQFASRWWHGITAAMHSLAEGPEKSHLAQENDQLPFPLFEFLYGKRSNKHRILFRIEGNQIVILHIRHSARDDLRLEDLE